MTAKKDWSKPSQTHFPSPLKKPSPPKSPPKPNNSKLPQPSSPPSKLSFKSSKPWKQISEQQKLPFKPDLTSSPSTSKISPSDFAIGRPVKKTNNFQTKTKKGVVMSLDKFFTRRLEKRGETTSTSPPKMRVRLPQNDTGFRRAKTPAQIAARRKRVDASLKTHTT